MGASRVVNEFAKLFFENTKNSTTFGRCLKNVKLISAEGGNCRAEFTVDEEHTNLGGSLHGGFTSTLIDCITTYALVSHGSGTPGVSVNLHVTFMKAAFPGDNLIIDAKTIRAGKTLAYLEAELKMKEGGAIVARGQHTKFIATAKICKYKGRQMTAGQINIDCFSKATCMSDGNIKKVPSCPRYFCLPKSKVTGYKRFEPNQLSFPHCCGGEICEEKYKSFW